MNYRILLRIFISTLLTGLAAGCGNETQSEPAGQKSTGAISSMRVKQLARELALTAEQQEKVRLLIDQEGAQIAKIDEAGNLSITERAIRVSELQKKSYEKIKPLLTPPQLDKLEQMLARMESRKRKTN